MKRISSFFRFIGLTLLLITTSVFSDDREIKSSDGDEKLSSSSMTNYAMKLALIEGHLWVANELVNEGHLVLGSKHSKHPAQEVYKDLKPLFESINSRGFAAELERMAMSLENKNTDAFQISYLAVVSAINSIYPEMSLTVSQELEVALGLLQQALIEYEVGVNNEGAVVDLQEYQDARGFAHIAEERIRRISFDDQSKITKGQLSELHGLFSMAYELWPSLIGSVSIEIESEPLSKVVDYIRELQKAY